MIGSGDYIPGGDVTGRKRIIWNILASWGGHMVFVVAGFLMPRMIDRHVGQASLGIWDFAWTMVSYFGLAGLGIGHSINRYVAKFRAAGDKEGLDGAVSSVLCAQCFTATAFALLTAAAVAFLPHFFKEQSAAELSEARWVVGLLGATLVVQELCDAFRGLITGCHRWDIHNAINAVSYGSTVALMIASLSMGNGLRSIAAVYLGAAILTEICRYRIARKVCPELEIGIGKASWRQAREMIYFGIKAVVAGIPGLIIMQGSSLMIARHLGPAMLAVFSRPLGLVSNAQAFLNKYALVLTPTAGSMQGAGLDDEVRELAIRTARYGVALSLPIVLFLSILGGPVLRLWMGPRYDAEFLMVLFAGGSFLRMTQSAAMTILVGLNAHGFIGVLNLAFAVAAMGIGAVVLHFTGWSLVGAAILITAFRVLNGASILVYSCRRLEIPIGRYLRKSFAGPMAAGVPLAIALAAVNRTLGSRPLVAVAAGCAVSGLILVPIYWRCFLPLELKEGIRRLPGVGGMIRALEVR